MTLHQQNPSYGAGSSYCNTIAKLAVEWRCHTALDFGCGKGNTAIKLNTNPVLNAFQFECQKYDPAIPKFSKAPDQSKDRYDLIIANDVFEHFDPNDLTHELVNVGRLSVKLIFANISCRPAVTILANGLNAHTSLYDSITWRAKMDQCWPFHSMIHMEWHPKNKNLVVAYARKELTNSSPVV